MDRQKIDLIGGGTVFFSTPKGGPHFFLKIIVQKFSAPSPQPFLLACFLPYNMFIHNLIFFSTMSHPLLSLFTAPFIVYVRGMFFHVGDQKFFIKPKGGPQFFPRMQRGGPNFVYVCKEGGQKKMATGHHKKSVPSIPVKNDSSLILIFSGCSSLSQIHQAIPAKICSS